MNNIDVEDNRREDNRRDERGFGGVWISDAVIDSVIRRQNDTSILVTYRSRWGRRDRQTVQLNISRNARIYDLNGRNISSRALRQSMRIDALISEAMTRSIPPIAQVFQIIVLDRPRETRRTTEGRVLQVNTRNQSILVMSSTNPTGIIQFNISPETQITGFGGRRIQLNDLFPGVRVRVEHAVFMTASIPPQTAAFGIQVLI